MKKAVIVGGSSGIGRALALALAVRGYKVGVTGRRQELLDSLATQAEGSVVTLVHDTTSKDSEQALDAFIGTLGGMDLFLFCAGTGDINAGLDLGIEERTNEVNVVAFTRALGFAYRYFAAHGGGHIVVVTSVMGLRGSGTAPSYAASKAYQINYLEGLRQLAVTHHSGIAVTDIRPGSVDTDMMKGEGHFWISSPSEAAETIVSAIRKKKPVAYVTPRWQVVGTFLKWLPRAIHKRMKI